MSNARKKKKGDGILRTLFKGGHRLDHRGRVGGRTDKFFSEIKNQKLIQ
jgi:hypothetical protein